MTSERYDVVVVGGGAAGLSGAVALARARRRVLVLDAGEWRNAPADGVHNYLTRDGMPPADLVAAGREELRSYGGEVVTATAVTARRLEGPLERATGGFEVALADGTAVRARRLLVTTGLVDELPDVPGVRERWGSDVLHCPYCHGWEVRDQPVGVLATSPMSMHQAQMWRQWTSDLTLLRHTGPAPTAQEAEQLAARGVRMIEGEVVGLEVDGGRLRGARLADGTVVPLAAVVVAPVLTARSGVLSGLGLEPEPLLMGDQVVGTRIPAQPTGATTVPGVWVAGNVTDLQAQVVVAAGAGLAAGTQINADLVQEDTRLAVTARAESPARAAHSAKTLR